MIEKIKKLLALSESSNPHEAELALRKANVLMQEHQITHIDLIPKQEVTHSDIEEVTRQHYRWASTLASACAQLFDCISLNTTHPKGFRFIGSEEHIVCAHQLFWHLFEAWKGMCKTDYQADRPSDRKMYRKSHGLGFANTIAKRVLLLRDERHDAILKATGTDLVVVKDHKVKSYMYDTFNIQTLKSRSLITNSSGYSRGQVSGQKVSLSTPLGKKKENDRI